MEKIWTWIADRSGRADKTLAEAFQEGLGTLQPQDQGVTTLLSRSRIQSLLKEGKGLRQGSSLRPKDLIQIGDSIELTLPAPEPLTATPQDIPLEILFEDSDVAIINKAPTLPVHPSAGHPDGTLVNSLMFHVKDLSGIGGTLRPGIVHRLDMHTSGALIISKSDAAHLKLAEIFSEHQINRTYWALVYGEFQREEIKIATQIARSPSDRKKMAVCRSGGRSAVTFARGIEYFREPGKRPFATLVEARLLTGRTHQVRVHLTHLGHSLLGDPTYGTPSHQQTKWKALPPDIRKAVEKLPGQALHARTLGLDHPIQGNPILITAPLEIAPHYSQLLTLLRTHYGN